MGIPGYIPWDLVFLDHIVNDPCRHRMICMFCGKFPIFRDRRYVVQCTDEGWALPQKNDRDQMLQSVEVISRLSVDGGYVLAQVLIQLLERNLTRPLVALSVGTAIWET